jgi:hypothetical protein
MHTCKEDLVTRKTQGVQDLVGEVLNTIPEPYSEDVILNVCVAIERQGRWLRRYRQLLSFA